MHKFILFILLLSSTNIFSQTPPNEFLIKATTPKITNSVYNKIDFIDSRIDIDKDAANYGEIKVGGFFKPVITAEPIEEQLTEVLQSLTDQTAQAGGLLLQLRKFYFGRLSRTWTDRGFYYIKADLYATDELNRYQKLDSIDTVIVVKAAVLNPALFKSASNTFANFIGNNLLRRPTPAASYSLTEIMYIDEIEKRRLPLYTSSTYTDGLYLNYTSFKNQLPDRQVTVEIKNGMISTVKDKDEFGEMFRWKLKDVYAIVHMGKTYISTNTGYYLLYKTQNDFYFTGKFKIAAPTGDYIMAGMLFGVLGAMLVSDHEAIYHVMIDHLNGGFIKLRQIKQ